MSYPRKAHALWDDSDYARAILHVQEELAAWRANHGTSDQVEAVYSKTLFDLRAGRAALRS